MLKKELIKTKDGSNTIYIPDWNEHYHSKHGAIQEALHVFITNGLHKLKNQSSIHILEYGFGTGLNFLLTLLISKQNNSEIFYTALEKYPLNTTDIKPLAYEKILTNLIPNSNKTEIYELLMKTHNLSWSDFEEVTEKVRLKKLEVDFKDFSEKPQSYDLVYFDAFGKRVQPELWTEDIFENIYNLLKPNGLFTTYACNGDTKRALTKVGFEVEKVPGPPGKREMINAWKK